MLSALMHPQDGGIRWNGIKMLQRGAPRAPPAGTAESDGRRDAGSCISHGGGTA